MIGIVGGGISGLLLLHLLRKRGIEALLLEASSVPGGVMGSREVEGPDGPVVVDLGPQRMRLTPGLREIVEELGLAPSLITATPGLPFSMYRRGRLHAAPLSLRDALTTSLISWRGKVRALGDLFTRGPEPGESVADALDRKLGPEIRTRLAGPILGGLYASDPREMEVRHTLLPALRRMGGGRSLLLALRRLQRWERLPVVSFREGMGALPRSLLERHRDAVRLDDPVRRVRVAGKGRLVLETAGGEVAASAIVLTLPAPEAAGLLAGLEPAAGERVGSLRYNPLAVVPLVVPEGTARPRVGSGFKLTLDEPGTVRGVTAHDALFSRPGLFTAFLGGRGREEVVARPDEEILAVAREEFRRVTGAEAVPLAVHRTRMPAWDRSWGALEGLRLPAGVHLCSAYAGRPGIVGRLEDAGRLAAGFPV